MISDMFAVGAATVSSTSTAGPKFVEHHHQAGVEEQVKSHGEELDCTVINDEHQSDK